ncbi:MAG: HlyD family efflux transporter periplasmic adaptor subunit [Verrucomicrobia bacterium]|nr:HlyD family efflux transporter periplasmic adaptor subunit [Verrucomicrobiota bacterium]
MNVSPSPKRRPNRKLFWLALLAAMGAAAFWISPFKASKKSALVVTPLTLAAANGPFLQEVVERGEVGSSSNVEIRCQVQSKSPLGTPIIQIVTEGTYVNEGEFLVKLDDSGLQADLIQQQIACNTSRALEVEGRTDYESSKIALQEYESGTYVQDRGAAESEQFVAQENLRRAEEYLRYSLRLAERGYVTEVQLEADRFAVGKARKELENSSTKLDVLEKYTRIKNLNRLRANVETAEARMRSRTNSRELDEDKLKTLEDQLSKCVIYAPTSGQVVYANPPTGDPLIAEGKLVRERQIIIRLPDPKRMQVVARINESRIDKLKVGMPSKIRLDAFPKNVLTGVVRSVTEYPLPAATPYSTIKEYGAAEEGGALASREIQVRSANETSVVVSEGLSVGEKVVLAPQSVESLVVLPEAVVKATGDKKKRKPVKTADNAGAR